LGGRILELGRQPEYAPPPGHTLAGKARPLLADYDSVMAEARRMVRGKSDRLRIGYVASAMHEYLEPALALLRRTYPKLKIKMLDQTPGEMIIELRRGEIDLALTNHGVDLLSRDFYTHKLASVPSSVALPCDHPLVNPRQIRYSPRSGND
jgi:DNA-binding transcriptional LysR family regulator